ncbi:hypothetical protein AYI69_g897 [Smittium culicis]|uniref:Uncharacterized protein n=1 Tax=Smittium culicis TaxID=133412 RepID=A0A1R1YRW8_9FUNG|nr:hypothetical protein AYI69_g897 [Smittium culicis]
MSIILKKQLEKRRNIYSDIFNFLNNPEGYFLKNGDKIIGKSSILKTRPAIVGILERFEIINENTSSDENDEISGDSDSSKETDEESSENEYSELSVKKHLKTAFEKASAPIKKQRTDISSAKDLNSIVRKEIT